MSTTRKGLTKAEKDRWVKALVSGKYEQCLGGLMVDDQYCCLGVLGKIEGVSNRRLNGHVTLSSMNDLRLLVQVDPNGKDAEDALIELNDFHIDGEPCPVPFELIAGLVIDPWNGKD